MNTKRFIILLLVLTIAYNSRAEEQVEYAKTYLEARQRAIEENKPYLIIFENDDCDPCQWMSQNTLGDQQVEAMINKNFIAVKVDIDDFDGFALKKYYQVNNLPSILVFSPKGAEWQRVEQALTVNEFLQVLAKPQSGHSIVRKDNTDKPKPNQPVPDKPTKEELPADRAYFAVQLGVFSDQTNAQELAERVERVTSDKVIVKKDGGHFKVFSGASTSKGEAEAHLRKLKDYGYDGFIKSISMNSKI